MFSYMQILNHMYYEDKDDHMYTAINSSTNFGALLLYVAASGLNPIQRQRHSILLPLSCHVMLYT